MGFQKASALKTILDISIENGQTMQITLRVTCIGPKGE